MPHSDGRSRFGDFQFDGDTLQLSRRDAPVPVSGLPLRILEILLASGGRVVTRAEFKQALWPYATRIDTERRLNTAVRALREALGDSGGESLYIETIRGRGYRWLNAEMARIEPKRTWRLSLLVFALTFAITGSVADLAAPPSAGEQARLIQLASATDRQSALAGIEQLVRDRPDFAEAQLFRAQLSVEAWRTSPDEAHLREASRAVAAATGAIGASAPLSTLSAELELAGRWNWGRAEQLYRRALSEDPDHIAALRGLAWLQVNAGRPDLAWAPIGRLLALTSLTGDSRADLGWLLLRMERADLALQVCGSERMPINLIACRHTALERLGNIAEARDAALALMEAVAADPAARAEVRALSPEPAYRRFLAWRATQFLPQEGHWFQRAQVQAAAGRHAAALDALDRAFDLRDPSLVKLASTPEFRALRQSPRFRALLGAVTGRTS